MLYVQFILLSPHFLLPCISYSASLLFLPHPLSIRPTSLNTDSRYELNIPLLRTDLVNIPQIPFALEEHRDSPRHAGCPYAGDVNKVILVTSSVKANFPSSLSENILPAFDLYIRPYLSILAAFVIFTS